MYIQGVIPSAGKGSRWGGFYKELLPTTKGEWLINRTIEAMNIADEILVVTRKEKIGAHASHLNGNYPNVSYTLQKDQNDIMGAIRASYPFAKMYNLFAMPDTYYPKDIFEKAIYVNLELGFQFALGIHKTRTPERFGVLYWDERNRVKVVNKQAGEEDTDYWAWGSMIWSHDVADLWEKLDIVDYTEAINVAIKEFGLHTYEMEYYYDMANWNDYFKLLQRLENESK